MKISVFYDHIEEASRQAGLPVSEILKRCREAGVEGVEIRDICLKARETEIRRELEAAPIEVSCVYAFFEFGESPDTSAGREAVRLAERAGAGRVLAVPGFLPEEEAAALGAARGLREETEAYMNKNARVRHMRDALETLCSFAAGKGIVLTLEDFDGYTAPFSGIYQLLWFMENTPGLHYTLDTGNFVYSDENVLDAFGVLQRYIAHVHCKDRAPDPKAPRGVYSRGLLPAPVGKGYLPMGEVLQRLLDMGYGGFLAAEHFGATDQMEYIRESARFLSDWLHTHACG